MTELRTQMEQGRREALSNDVALERLTALRDRRRRNGRVLSAAVALAVTGAMVVGAVAVLNHRGAPTGVGDDHTGAGATTAPYPQSSGGAPSPTLTEEELACISAASLLAA